MTDQGYIDGLMKEIENDVLSCYFVEDIKKMNFKDFFDEIDVSMTYEEEWEPELYKPFYKEIYTKLTGAQA